MRLVVFLLLLAGLAGPSGAATTYGPYRAQIVRIIDGDTVEAVVELWPSLQARSTVRLRGIDTPELRGSTACERALAQRARDYLATLALGPAQVDQVEIDKYGGRVVGAVEAKGVDLASAMKAAGVARAYDGGRREPWCG